MPVIVEAVVQPSAQDRTDLEKIYADAPAWLLAPYPDAAGLIEAGLARGCLIAGRFNDRLLGAAWLQQDASGWRLSHLCVRKITRGRGVGQRLIAEARQRAGDSNQPLRLQAPLRQLEVQALAKRLDLAVEDVAP
jgi:GNAT superfamily N-acetyltransferase